MYRRGWFNDSHRHYLAAKGIKTNRYFAELAQPTQAPVAPTAAPPVMLTKNINIRSGAPSKGQPDREIGGRVRSEKSVREKLGEEGRLRADSELEIKKRGEAGYSKVIATKDPVLLRKELIAQNQLLGQGDDVKTTNRIRALQAKLGEIEFERARAGMPVNTSGLSPAAKQDLEQFAKAKNLQDATKEPTSVFGQFMQGLGERAATEFGRTGREAELIQAKRLEQADATEEFMRERARIDAQGLTGWENNPIVQDTRYEPFYGAFNPFEMGEMGLDKKTGRRGNGEKMDVTTPLKDRSVFKFDSSFSGSAGNADMPWTGLGVDGTKKAVAEVHAARRELASADKSAFQRGKIAFQRGDREDLVNAIVDLSSQADKLDEMQMMVQGVEGNVTSQEHIAKTILQDQGWMSSPFGGSRARELADEAAKIAETKAEIRKQINEVKGRRDNLKEKLNRMNASLPPETLQTEGIVEVFREDKRVIESPVTFAQTFVQESHQSSPKLFASKRYR